MFKNLNETVKALNADVNNVANCEKAKSLRKKLLAIGLPMAICGFLGAFVCFAVFAVTAVTSMNAMSFSVPTGIVIPFILFIPCGVVGGIGLNIASIGFKIVITGYTTNLVNETVGNNCPKCGETIELGSSFCPKCGERLKKRCEACNHVNSHKNDYCENCGKKL